MVEFDTHQYALEQFNEKRPQRFTLSDEFCIIPEQLPTSSLLVVDPLEVMNTEGNMRVGTAFFIFFHAPIMISSEQSLPNYAVEIRLELTPQALRRMKSFPFVIAKQQITSGTSKSISMGEFENDENPSMIYHLWQPFDSQVPLKKICESIPNPLNFRPDEIGATLFSFSTKELQSHPLSLDFSKKTKK